MNNKFTLMFHEILDDFDIKSGWNLESKSKYTITKKHFRNIILKFGNKINYSFDDGGKSNFYAANELHKNKIRGIFFISTYYIGKEGFLNINEIKTISKNHFVFSHGHKHIMNSVSYEELKQDWTESLNIMKQNKLRTDLVCLPGGFFTLNHAKVFEELNVKYIFHSATSNILLHLLYKNQFKFKPRIIVNRKFNTIKLLNYTALKSLIKQVFDYLK